MNQEDLLPDLPPLTDDGALSDVDDGFAPDETDIGTDDRAASDLALGALVLVVEEGASVLDDRPADIEGYVAVSNEPESGWLDDATMDVDLGVQFEAEEHAPIANDSGADGIDEGARAIPAGSDDDATGLPQIVPGSDGEGIDEPVIVPSLGDD